MTNKLAEVFGQLSATKIAIAALTAAFLSGGACVSGVYALIALPQQNASTISLHATSAESHPQLERRVSDLERLLNITVCLNLADIKPELAEQRRRACTVNPEAWKNWLG
jgi:hypothetical protein